MIILLVYLPTYNEGPRGGPVKMLFLRDGLVKVKKSHHLFSLEEHFC